jgi:hypothetical protein
MRVAEDRGSWMRVAEDRARWRDIGEAYAQQRTSRMIMMMNKSTNKFFELCLLKFVKN